MCLSCFQSWQCTTHPMDRVSSSSVNNSITLRVIESKTFKYALIDSLEALIEISHFVTNIAPIIGSVGEQDGRRGKHTKSLPMKIFITLNFDMINVLSQEKNRLKIIVFFLAIMDISKIPTRKSLNELFKNVWLKKLGFQIFFCKMIQKGLFLIFIKDPKMQESITDKQYWRIGKYTFRVLKWMLDAINDELMALLCPRWIIVKNVPLFLQSLVPQILDYLGKVLKQDDVKFTLPHMDVRVLISLNLCVMVKNSYQGFIDYNSKTTK